MRLPPLFTSFCVLVLGLGIGCSTSDSGEAPTVVASESPTAKELSVETILARAQRATGSLQTVHISQTMEQKLAGIEIVMAIEMDVERPDQAYAVFETEALGNFEMVIDRLELFVRFPGEEWQTAERRLGSSPGEMGFAPPDFAAQLDVLPLASSLELLDDVEVDGVLTYHVRAIFDAPGYFSATGDVLGATGVLADGFESATGEVIQDYYISHEDFLIRRFTSALDVVILGIPQVAASEATLSAFDEPVEIPKIDLTSVPSPAGTPFELLAVNDCFSLVDELTANGEVAVIDCDEPHQVEVFFEIEYGAGVFPGRTELLAVAEDECLSAFEPFVGRSYAQSEVFLDFLTPTEANWEAGDRRSLCLLLLEGGDFVTGSFEGSRC